jgi:hypothetical protein
MASNSTLQARQAQGPDSNGGASYPMANLVAEGIGSWQADRPMRRAEIARCITTVRTAISGSLAFRR